MRGNVGSFMRNTIESNIRSLGVAKENLTATESAIRDVDIADAILSRAADSNADFMVMGGYGHSRLRQFILGGATRGILQSMTVPTLLSH